MASNLSCPAGGLLGDLCNIATNGSGSLFEFLAGWGIDRLLRAENEAVVLLDLTSAGGSNKSSPSLEPGEYGDSSSISTTSVDVSGGCFWDVWVCSPFCTVLVLTGVSFAGGGAGFSGVVRKTLGGGLCGTTTGELIRRADVGCCGGGCCC